MPPADSSSPIAAGQPDRDAPPVGEHPAEQYVVVSGLTTVKLRLAVPGNLTRPQAAEEAKFQLTEHPDLWRRARYNGADRVRDLRVLSVYPKAGSAP